MSRHAKHSKHSKRLLAIKRSHYSRSVAVLAWITLPRRNTLEKTSCIHAIDECEWPIIKTAAYKNFVPAMPKGNSKYDGGFFLMTATPDNVAICFFNSLNDIIANKNVKEDLIPILLMKKNFYIVCNFTRNRNHQLMLMENLWK